MSGLPDRDEVLPSVFDDELRAIGFAYVQGDLKSRDEMNEEALLAAVQRGESPGKIADAAFGVDDE